MGTPGLRDHMARFGVFSNSWKAQLADAVVMNPQIHAMGNAKTPYLPVYTNPHDPVQANRAVVDYLSHTTAHQAWLRNRSPMPGLTPGAANMRPQLIAQYQMARMGMDVNRSNSYQSPVGRQSAAVSVGSKHKMDKKRFG